MNAVPPSSISRILFALGEEGDVAGAFEFTANLALMLDAELRGVYVEDADLLRLAALPFARETGTTTAVVRRLQLSDIERGWQRQAARLHKDLEQVAVRRQLRWSFQVVRGRMTTQVVEEALETDLVAVSSVTRVAVESLQALVCPVLILPARLAPGSAVGVLVDGSPASETALRFAATLVPATTGELRSVIVVTAPGVREHALKQAASVLAGVGVRIRVLALTAADAAVMTQLLKVSGIRTLVLAAGSVAQSPWLRPLLDRPPCAVWMTH